MQLGDYNLIEKIGAGGMGEVWYAENMHTKVPYAVKLLPVAATNDHDFVARFFDEGRIMAQLDHPNIVRVHHVGHDASAGSAQASGGRYYLVMDLIVGATDANEDETVAPTLHDLLAEASDSRLPEKDVRRWATQIAEALAYAHEHGVIHRDIKPANILIDQNGNARVTDFGLAKAVGEEYLQSQIHVSIQQSMGWQRTEDGRRKTVDRIEKSMGDEKTLATGYTVGSQRSSADSLLGTYDYMSPEQRGELSGVEVSPASDVYAFGVMLYRMLTGRRPAGKAKDPSRLVRGLSRQWDRITDKCLEHQPQDRYVDGQALCAAIKGRAGLRAGSLLKFAATFLVMAAVVLAGWQYGMRPWLEKRKPEREQTRIAGETLQQINSLLSEARHLYDTKQFADAGEKVAEVLALDAENRDVEKLKQQIRLAVGMEQTVPEKTKAEMALSRAKGFEQTWPGRDKLVQDAELALKNGLAFYDKEEYGMAVEKFRAVQATVSELNAQDAAWQGAVAANDAAEKAMNAARAYHAERDAPALWKKAMAQNTSAEKAYGLSSFQEAISAYQSAVTTFKAAESYAKGLQSVKKARSGYDSVRHAVALDLDRYGSSKWQAVKDAVASADLLLKSERWTEAVAKYGEAREGLAAAVTEAAAAQPFATGKRWCLLIGCDSYSNPNVPELKWAEKDTANVEEALIEDNRGLFSENCVTVLKGPQVTRERVLNSLRSIATNAAPGDFVFVHYSGHGALDQVGSALQGSLRAYLVMHDTDPGKLKVNGLSMQEFSEDLLNCMASEVVFFLDACHSGAAGVAMAADNGAQRLVTSPEAHALIKSGTVRNVDNSYASWLRSGRHLVTACGENQLAQEDFRLQNGLLTYYLLQAIYGPADTDGDLSITLNEAYNAIYAGMSQFVPENSAGTTQVPQKYEAGSDPNVPLAWAISSNITAEDASRFTTIAGCATSTERQLRQLSISCRPEATVTLQCPKFRSPLLLGVAGKKKLNMDRIWVANSLIADPALSKGKPDASTEILLEELVNVTKVTLQVEAQTEPGLYAKKALTVPPWDYDIDLGIPAQVSRSEKIGVAFALPEGMAGYRLRIQNQELNLPTKLELTEGEYIFQLLDTKGTTFSGLLQLYNSDAEFMRFAFVPVFQKINAVELKEIAHRKREPRLYTTRIEGKSTVLANVWLGSRRSTEGVVLGSGGARNIEILFSLVNVKLLLDGKPVSNRFNVAVGKKYYLTINIPGKNEQHGTVYGLLDVRSITRADVQLTSFSVTLSSDEISAIIEENKIVKMCGSYQLPERPDEEVRIFDLTLGKRMLSIATR